MREFFKSWKFKVIIGIFALMFGFMIYAAASAGTASLPEFTLSAVTQPFARLSSDISDKVKDTIDKLVNADYYKRENEELMKQLSEFHQRVINFENLEKELGQYMEMFEIAKENEDFQWSPPCTVTARNANDVFGGFTINRGSDDGISLYDTVITKIGIVGVVTEVAPNYSKVATIISTEVKVGVMTSGSHTIGLIENDILYAKDGYCLMNHIKKDSDIKVGDVIVTSGSEMYPANQIIGDVIEVFDDKNGLSVHAVIKPRENISSITDVFVVTDFKGKGINPDEPKKTEQD